MTNTSTLELKRAVERIVRPINAGWRRKLAMREELLSHLMSSYDKVHMHEASEAAAIDTAIQQLGDPEAVRREYQASVPNFERKSLRKIGGDPRRLSGWGRRGGDETELRYILRVGLTHGILCALAAIVFVTIFASSADGVFTTTRSMPQVALAIASYAILSALYIAFAHRVLPRVLDRMYGIGAIIRTSYGFLGAILMLVPALLSTAPIVILLHSVNPWESIYLTGFLLMGVVGLFPAILGYQFFPASVTEWERLEIGE